MIKAAAGEEILERIASDSAVGAPREDLAKLVTS